MIFVRNVLYAQVVLFFGFGVFSCRCKSQDEGELGKIMLLQTCVLQVYDKPPVFLFLNLPEYQKSPDFVPQCGGGEARFQLIR